MPKYLVVRYWFGEENPEVFIEEAETDIEVFDKYEDYQNALLVVKITPEIKEKLKKIFE